MPRDLKLRENSARLIAAVAAPLILLHATPARCEPVAAAAPQSAAVAQMDHISVEAVGRGTPVILIPGLSMSRENWRATADHLKANHRVYLVQLNGFGGSALGANPVPGMLDGVVADLHGFIEREKIVGAAVVGHSLGGTLALKLALAHPGDVRQVMIVDALPWVGNIMAPATATPAMIEPQARAMRDGIAATYGKPKDPARVRLSIAPLALKPASQAAAVGWSIEADPRVTAEAFYEDLMADMRGDVSKLTMPVTLVYPWAATGPAKDAADQLYHSQYAKVPHMRFVDVGDSAHFVILDQPEAFTRALDAFLAG